MAETVKEILSRKYCSGTRVTNCVLHMQVPWDARPSNCELCQTDIRNHISYCHGVNEWLNQCLNDARKAHDSEEPAHDA